MPQTLWSTFNQNEYFKRTLGNRLAFSICLSVPIPAILMMFLLPDELESGRFCVGYSISQIVAVTVFLTSYHPDFISNKFLCFRHYQLRWPYIPQEQEPVCFLVAGKLHSASPCGCSIVSHSGWSHLPCLWWIPVLVQCFLLQSTSNLDQNF